jgi:hypothetical protein
MRFMMLVKASKDSEAGRDAGRSPYCCEDEI